MITYTIYKKDNNWYRTETEIDEYDEKIYVEVPGIEVPINYSLDELVDFHLNKHYGRIGSIGLKEKYKPGEVITMSAFLREKEFKDANAIAE